MPGVLASSIGKAIGSAPQISRSLFVFTLTLTADPCHPSPQVTTNFKGSSQTVKVKVASKIVHGGYMLKKGELNSEFQLRFFLLIDEAEGSILRYYEGASLPTQDLGELCI